MTEHRNLTGASLHEPKGVETATAGQVYVADGLGSGAWTSRFTGINNLNKFTLNGSYTDVGTASTVFFVVPAKSTLTKVTGVLGGAITGANSVITLYKNSIAQTPLLTVPFTGSGSGVTSTATYNISFVEGDTLELRNDGASTGPASYSFSANFTAIP